MYRLFLFAIIVIAGSFIVSCQDDQVPTKTIMEFSVDSSLVNVSFHDTATGISYRLPGEWSNWTNDSSLNKALQQDTSRLRLIHLAGDTAAGLYWSLVDIRTASAGNFSQLRTDYQQVLNNNKQWDTVMMADYYKDGLQVDQYIMKNSILTNFRLIFINKNQPLVQMDYKLPNSVDGPRYTKILESIIGSLKTVY
jgi:hypothetical protein